MKNRHREMLKQWKRTKYIHYYIKQRDYRGQIYWESVDWNGNLYSLKNAPSKNQQQLRKVKDWTGDNEKEK